MVFKVLKLITNRVGGYFSTELNLNEIDTIKLKYSLEVILTDLSKSIILLLFYSLIGQTMFFIIAFPFLSLLRMYTGGFHLKTYLGCFCFSFIFFFITFICSTYVKLNDLHIILIVLFSIIAILIFSPVPSKSRPKYSEKKKLVFKLISLFLIMFSALIFYITNKNPYFISPIWVMSFQSLQIIISKEVMKK